MDVPDQAAQGESISLNPAPAQIPARLVRLVARWSAFSGWNLILVGLLSAITILELVFGSWSHPEVEVLASVLVIALLAFRRRSPFWICLAAVAVSLSYVAGLVLWSGSPQEGDIGSISVGMALLVLGYSAFRWSQLRQSVIAYLALVVAGITSAKLTEDLGVLALSLTQSIPWALVAAVAAIAIYRSRFAEQREVQVRLQERQELARELHDVVAHHVSAIAIQAQAAQAVAEVNPEAVANSLAAIERTASLTLTEMRRMVGILRGSDATAVTVGSLSLRDLADAPGEPKVQLLGDQVPAVLPVAVSAALTRIVQESITNARRHGQTNEPIVVDVAVADESIEVRITNHASAGSTTQNADGFGLIGMSERAQALQGEFRAGPLPGSRWQVYASLPFSHHREASQ